MASAQLETIVRLLRERPLVADIAQLRANMDTVAAQLPPVDGVCAEPVDAGGLPAEWLIPDDAEPGRTILFLHGGGYVTGSIKSHRDLASRMARAAAARTLLIDYRLAPEHPFPAAVDDATAAYRWLLSRGLDPGRVAIAGDSAGGGLTVATLIALRDAQTPLPAAGICLSPWLDLACTGDSITTRAAADPLVRKDVLVEFAHAYLNGADARAPLASPLYAGLSGLPPLLIHVGTAEVLLDDSIRFADRAKEGGVSVTLEIWDDMIHVWHSFAIALPEGQQAVDRLGTFIRDRTA